MYTCSFTKLVHSDHSVHGVIFNHHDLVVFSRHEFHKMCIDPWLVEHRTCPMCKLNILKELGVVSSALSYYAGFTKMKLGMYRKKVFKLTNFICHSHSHSNFSWAFLSKGERCMRLTLYEAPTRETRPDHNTGNLS